MSHVKRGRGAPGQRFTDLAQRIPLAVDEVAKAEALALQAEVVRRVPRRTGKLAALFASGEALAPLNKKGAYRFGIITPGLRRAGHYAWFVEYGTKGYALGSRRVYRTASGKARVKKVKKDIPPRPAQPFFRPALDAVRGRVKAAIAAAVKNELDNAK